MEKFWPFYKLRESGEVNEKKDTKYKLFSKDGL